MVGATYGMIEPPTVLRVNHPFVFAIPVKTTREAFYLWDVCKTQPDKQVTVTLPPGNQLPHPALYPGEMI